MEAKYYRISEAAKILGVNPNTMRVWDRTGKFKSRRHPMNNWRMYSQEDLDKIITALENHEKESAETKGNS
ncbi:MAG: MerR family transcriptional regulator [Candidatus Riesia sp.]|nr:MerR family transcriptional regulator [Candidatus Riesia sp.]